MYMYFKPFSLDECQIHVHTCSVPSVLINSCVLFLQIILIHVHVIVVEFQIENLLFPKASICIHVYIHGDNTLVLTMLPQKNMKYAIIEIMIGFTPISTIPIVT